MHIQQTRKWFQQQYRMSRNYIRRVCDELNIPKDVALSPKDVERLKEFLGDPIKA